MHYKFIIGILCWPVVLMGQSHLLPSITLFPVRSGQVTFYPHQPVSADLLTHDSTVCDSIAWRNVAWSDVSGRQTNLIPVELTLQQSLQCLNRISPALRMEDQLVGMARAEHARLRSFWYPSFFATGACVRLSQPIEVRQSLKPYAQSAKDWLENWLPGGSGAVAPLGNFPPSFPEGSLSNGLSVGATSCLSGLGSAIEGGLPSLLLPAASSFLDQLGSQTLSFPILSSQLTGVQLQFQWPLFTGGKRVYASRIGRRLVEGAELHRSGTEAMLQARMVETYFGLRLAFRVTEVRHRSLLAMECHYYQAVRLEQEGLMNKADRLFVQVARDEARREWESAVHQQQVALNALQVLLGLDERTPVVPLSPLFLNENLPPVSYFKDLLDVSNDQLNQVSVQEAMANDRVKMGRSAYLPTISLMGNQHLYSHHLPSHLVPRTMVGVGFSWTLFDGFRREGKVRRARCLQYTLHDGYDQLKDDLEVGVDRLYALMQHAQDEVSALHSSIRLTRELLRMRRKSFEEGMATSVDVVDAETLLAKVQVAYLTAYYEYDVSLAAILSLCGIPETLWSYVRSGVTEDLIGR